MVYSMSIAYILCCNAISDQQIITKVCDLCPQSCTEAYCYWQFGSVQVSFCHVIIPNMEIVFVILFSYCVNVPRPLQHLCVCVCVCVRWYVTIQEEKVLLTSSSPVIIQEPNMATLYSILIVLSCVSEHLLSKHETIRAFVLLSKHGRVPMYLGTWLVKTFFRLPQTWCHSAHDCGSVVVLWL